MEPGNLVHLAPKAPNSIKRPGPKPGPSWSQDLGDADALGARALRARLDFERNLLATLESVEVSLGATAVEEVFLSVLGLDKSKATIRNQLLDGACGHFHLLSLERRGYSTSEARSR